MYAVIETGGKQYRVQEGDSLQIEKLPLDEGDTYQFERVLMVSGPDETIIGQPTVEGAAVAATIEAHGRDKKIIVYKHKKNYHKKQGHRQAFTRVQIDRIVTNGEVAEATPQQDDVTLSKAPADAEVATVTEENNGS